MPKLLLKYNAAVIKEIPIEKTPITIGRKPDNDIVVDNLAVSGHHAKIILQGTSYVIEDLQSTNGTFLNSKKIINSAIRHDDQIAIGQHTLVFINPEAQSEPQAQAPKQQPISSDATVVITPQMLKQQMEAKQPPQNQPAQDTPNAAPQAPAPQKTAEKIGMLRLVEGKADLPEYTLEGLLTYIGKSDTAAIKIKGMFAPDIAALISKRPNGYLITAVKDGYPKLNGNSLSGQVELKDGDMIETGGLKFMFQLKDKS